MLSRVFKQVIDVITVLWITCAAIYIYIYIYGSIVNLWIVDNCVATRCLTSAVCRGSGISAGVVELQYEDCDSLDF